jgi:hypothetical protein
VLNNYTNLVEKFLSLDNSAPILIQSSYCAVVFESTVPTLWFILRTLRAALRIVPHLPVNVTFISPNVFEIMWV